jgi:hypothetical protein
MEKNHKRGHGSSRTVATDDIQEEQEEGGGGGEEREEMMMSPVLNGTPPSPGTIPSCLQFMSINPLKPSGCYMYHLL